LPAALIINPIAGRARPNKARTRLQLARSVAASLGAPIEVFVTESAGHARELTKVAVHRGARLVVAWGGDGTINEVASELAFTYVALGIVPAGSGNGLARELGVSTRPDRAIASALAARPRPIDMGEIDGHLFVNLAGIGFAAHVASAFAQSHRRGFLGYVGITLRTLRSYVPLEYAISTGGQVVRVRALLITLANSQQFGNGARIAPGARVDDGLLDLVTIEEQSRFATVRSLPRLFTGTVDRLRGCRIDRVREATIEAEQPLTFHVDGEPVEGGTTVHARVHPAALQIAV
jgi:diacylglycerol kinase (ATP)